MVTVTAVFMLVSTVLMAVAMVATKNMDTVLFIAIAVSTSLYVTLAVLEHKAGTVE